MQRTWDWLAQTRRGRRRERGRERRLMEGRFGCVSVVRSAEASPSKLCGKRWVRWWIYDWRFISTGRGIVCMELEI